MLHFPGLQDSGISGCCLRKTGTSDTCTVYLSIDTNNQLQVIGDRINCSYYILFLPVTDVVSFERLLTTNTNYRSSPPCSSNQGVSGGGKLIYSTLYSFQVSRRSILVMSVPHLKIDDTLGAAFIGCIIAGG